MLPEAVSAMNEAARHFVNIDELMAAVGDRLAQLTGAPWGIVTCGGAAAMTLGTAACVAGADPEKMLCLPDTSALNNRVVMLGSHRSAYDHAIRVVGVKIIAVDTLAELITAIAAPTAMIAVLAALEPDGGVSLEAIAEHARPRGIPILVDAAADRLRRPVPYLERGAQLVAYSGGKSLRGPAPTGLLLGDRALVEAAWRNAAPHHAFGRAMKVGKEEIMGLLAAVEAWAVSGDRAQPRWISDLTIIAGEVTRVAAVSAAICERNGPSGASPHLEVRWDGDRIPITGLDLRRRLLNTEPRIMLDDRYAAEGSLRVLPFSLQPGEAQAVGERLRQELAVAAGRPRAPELPRALTPPPAGQVAGEWDLTIDFVRGQAGHRLTIVQDNAKLAGIHHTAFHENRLSGAVHGGRVQFASAHPFEGATLCYRFAGTIADGRMAGAVELGSTSVLTPGPVNQGEFGDARWRAVRSRSSSL